jgi:exodeoxyribonuclease V alpha subunit
MPLVPSSRPQATGGSAPTPSETLEGEIFHVTFYNPQTGHTIAAVQAKGYRAPMTVVGKLADVQPGESVRLEGTWTVHPVYGRQFAVSRCATSRPGTAEAMRRYLGSGLVPGLGLVLAERLVNHFGEAVWEVLDHEPQRVAEVPGIGAKRTAWLCDAWAEHRALRDLIHFLSEHGINTLYGPRLLQTLGPGALAILRANPYRVAQEVPAVGFAAADALASEQGTPPGATTRLHAGVEAALLRATAEGHTYLPHEVLVEAAQRVLHLEEREVIEAAIQQLLIAERLIAPQAPRPAMGPSPLPAPRPASPASPATPATPRSGRAVRVYAAVSPARALDPLSPLYLPAYWHTEVSLAARLRAVAGRTLPADGTRVRAWLARWCAHEALALAPEQEQAVLQGTTCGALVLTGGPGSGKTTTLRALVGVLRAMGRSVLLAAPTGKAAKRMAEVIGLEAHTLHRLLGAQPGNRFRHDERNPLAADALVVDEASMLDLFLADATLRALGPQTQLILVGDSDQLPSVGPGQVLRDVLAVGQVPTVRLTQIFRQAQESQIIQNAARIRAGESPTLIPPSAPSGGGTSGDCVFVQARGATALETAARWAVDEVPQRLRLDAGADIQVLAPLTRSVAALNERLQARLNPRRPGVPERPHGALALRMGDRVIQTANDYRLQVFNGETGQVVSIDAGGGITVDYGDRRVAYGAGDLYALDHAYALTVHRAQGSEWPAVVVVLTQADAPLLSRPLLYTALTRAKRCAVLVGEAHAYARAAATAESMARYTGLSELLTASERGEAHEQAWG